MRADVFKVVDGLLLTCPSQRHVFFFICLIVGLRRLNGICIVVFFESIDDAPKGHARRIASPPGDGALEHEVKLPKG